MVNHPTNRLIRLLVLIAALSKTLVSTLSSLLVPQQSTSSQERLVARYASRFRLAFSLLNEDASTGGSVLGWDLESAVDRELSLLPLEHYYYWPLTLNVYNFSGALRYWYISMIEYLSPVLSQLSILHNFTIESQVQFHAPLAFEPPQSLSERDERRYILGEEELKMFVNSADWTLGQSSLYWSITATNIYYVSFQCFRGPRPSFYSFHTFRFTAPFNCQDFFRYAAYLGILLKLRMPSPYRESVRFIHCSPMGWHRYSRSILSPCEERVYTSEWFPSIHDGHDGLFQHFPFSIAHNSWRLPSSSFSIDWLIFIAWTTQRLAAGYFASTACFREHTG
jgi:Phosphatidylinositol-glycan biosynthesis class S protein